MNELVIMRQMDHPLIQGCEEIFLNIDGYREDNSEKCIVIISELAVCDLDKFIDRYKYDKDFKIKDLKDC